MTTENWQEAYETGIWQDLGKLHTALPGPVKALLDGPRVFKGSALDIGCGPGILTLPLCRYFPVVVGLDYVEAATRIAMEGALSADEPRPSFVTGDAFALPFADGSFDYAFDGNCLPNLEMANWQDYFSEIRRVLKPGGHFQLLTFYYVRSGIKAWLRGNVLRHIGFDAKWRSSLHRLDPEHMAKNLPQGFTCDTFESVAVSEHSNSVPYHTNIVCRRP